MPQPGAEDPRRTLSRAAWWLRGLGGAIVVAGVIALVMVLQAPQNAEETGNFWRYLRATGAIFGWIVPGLLMITFSMFIPRRKRWAITAAEVVTYIQMFFAGAMIVVSLLHVKGLWPMLIIGLVWIAPLTLTHHFTGPCSRAMDLIAQMVTLGVGELPGTRRESRRAK